jgi:hypothetical protein
MPKVPISRFRIGWPKNASQFFKRAPVLAGCQSASRENFERSKSSEIIDSYLTVTSRQSLQKTRSRLSVTTGTVRCWEQILFFLSVMWIGLLIGNHTRLT